MRRIRLLLVLPFALASLALPAYLLIKGVTYYRNPALLGDGPVAILLSLITYGLVLIATYVAIARLIDAVRPGERSGAKILSSQYPNSISREDGLQAIAAGAKRNPILAVGMATFVAAVPVVMLYLALGGNFELTSPKYLVMLIMCELPVAAVIAMVLIRIRRMRDQRTGNDSSN